MVWFLGFQFLEQHIHGIFEVFIVFPGLAGIDEFQQCGEILFLLRGLVPDVADQGTVELPLFYKECDVSGKLFQCHCGQVLE